nr:LOW QUALITY PROTEIN: skin secretory protein xP2-like [Macaca nemestrina]
MARGPLRPRRRDPKRDAARTTPRHVPAVSAQPARVRVAGGGRGGTPASEPLSEVGHGIDSGLPGDLRRELRARGEGDGAEKNRGDSAAAVTAGTRRGRAAPSRRPDRSPAVSSVSQNPPPATAAAAAAAPAPEHGAREHHGQLAAAESASSPLPPATKASVGPTLQRETPAILSLGPHVSLACLSRELVTEPRTSSPHASHSSSSHPITLTELLISSISLCDGAALLGFCAPGQGKCLLKM